MALAEKSLIKDQSLLRYEDIKQHIVVLPELAAYIPPLLAEEFNQLEENIKQNGCREALLVWETNKEQVADLAVDGTAYVLIDGHNRYAICQKSGIDYKVHVMNFASLDQVKFFMIDNQLGRRNLTPEQAAYLRGLRYIRQKQAKGKYNRDEHKGHSDPYEVRLPQSAPDRDNHKGHSDPYADGSTPGEFGRDSHKGQNDPYANETPQDGPGQVDYQGAASKQKSTAKRLSEQFNVSEKTIKRDGVYAQGLEKLTPAFRQQILGGETKVDKALVQQLGQLEKTVDPVADVAALEQVLAHTATQPTKTLTKQTSGEVRNSQLRQKLKELVSQLNLKNADLTHLCDDIIDCAQKLKRTGQAH